MLVKSLDNTEVYIPSLYEITPKTGLLQETTYFSISFWHIEIKHNTVLYNQSYLGNESLIYNETIQYLYCYNMTHFFVSNALLSIPFWMYALIMNDLTFAC